MHRNPRRCAAVAACTALAAGWLSQAAAMPAEFVGEPMRRVADGVHDDLLSAGLGAEGLRGPVPAPAEPLAPTATELRRRAVWSDYRALTDLSAAGGFGRLSGVAEGERIAGIEYLAALRRPDGAGVTAVMLQVPAHFDRARPCLVAVASSGSRGVYGALPTAGEWGLRRGCAVVHTDKGTGIGFEDLDTGTAWRIDLAATRDPADPLVNWRVARSAALEAWRRAHPHRAAVVHAHSRRNVERDWGLYLLQAIRAGFELLEREFPAGEGQPAVTRASTRVIASGISNGGNTVLRAVEADIWGLIDAAVVSEPNVSVDGAGLEIVMGDRPPAANAGLPLFDYAWRHYLLQPAAVLAPSADWAMTALPPAQRPVWEAWASLLAEAGLVAGDTPAERGADARRQLEALGVLREALDGGVTNVAFGLWPAVAEAYASAYARLGPDESPCGLSYAPTDAQFRARAPGSAELAMLAANGSGIPPTAGLQLVDASGLFQSLGSFEHALCIRELATGRRLDGSALPPAAAAVSTRLRQGIAEVRASARLRGVPVIIVHGRRDALIPVNFSSRAYYARHRATGEDSLRYYEVEHGHHFDAFNALPGWAGEFVPLQPQLLAAMDLMDAHLDDAVPLPPSQVVRSERRAAAAGGFEPLEARHLGAIRAEPGADTIRWQGGRLLVPQ